MKIIIINGPNLNMLHLRNSKHYGTLSLDQMNLAIKEKYPEIDFVFYQSNWEGKIIDVIHEFNNFDALIINPAAYTHTSIAIRDALELVNIPKVAVHLSNYLNREDFRKTDFISDVVDKVFYGKQIESYYEAIDFIISKIYDY